MIANGLPDDILKVTIPNHLHWPNMLYTLTTLGLCGYTATALPISATWSAMILILGAPILTISCLWRWPIWYFSQGARSQQTENTLAQ